MLDGVLIGSSASVERAREQYRCALHTDAPVVIAGEKGTEKEALARAIHEMGSRKGEPFLVVTADHGHLPVNGANHAAGNGSSNGSRQGSGASLEEAQLSSVGGASTHEHAWRFAKGTLYFPDANALSLPAQSALVELLSGVASSSAGAEPQSGERPRVIAALEQAAEESWAQSTLRRVFERVGGVRIELPSLRERGRDIALLAEHFAEQLRLARGDAYLRITPTALEALARYHWPGNVDELRLAIQHAASLCAQSTIRVADLPPSISLSMDTPTEEHAPRLQVQSLEDMELKYILRVLHAVGGNKASAARLLGVDRTTLYRKLQRQQPLALARTDARVQPQRAVK
jgi:DNA-binding NtrC family response regulator